MMDDEFTSYPKRRGTRAQSLCALGMSWELQSALGREPPAYPRTVVIACSLLEGGAQTSYPRNSMSEHKCSHSCCSFTGYQAYYVLFKLWFHIPPLYSWAFLFLKQISYRLAKAHLCYLPLVDMWTGTAFRKEVWQYLSKSKEPLSLHPAILILSILFCLLLH